MQNPFNDVSNLSDSNGIRTHNHLFRKRTLNRLPSLASLPKWLSICLRTNRVSQLQPSGQQISSTVMSRPESILIRQD